MGWKRIFQEIPFYNTYIEKLSELYFCEELNIVKTDKEFKGNEMTYKVELIDKKDPLVQLEASKSIIGD